MPPTQSGVELRSKTNYSFEVFLPRISYIEFKHCCQKNSLTGVTKEHAQVRLDEILY